MTRSYIKSLITCLNAANCNVVAHELNAQVRSAYSTLWLEPVPTDGRDEEWAGMALGLQPWLYPSVFSFEKDGSVQSRPVECFNGCH